MSNKIDETIVLGGGCFWCLDAGYKLVKGVTEVVAGYAGGTVPDPTYQQVCAGTTGHAEVVQVSFDSSIITLAEILDIFWIMHDPTTLNRQGADVGPQYRSVILYTEGQQKTVIQASLESASRLWNNRIVTQVEKLTKFYPAESEHQNYFQKHPEAAYCQVVINPKLAKLRTAFMAKLK